MEAAGRNGGAIEPVARQELAVVHLVAVQRPFGFHSTLAVCVLAKTVAFHFACKNTIV